jgi:hypothetical protein
MNTSFAVLHDLHVFGTISKSTRAFSKFSPTEILEIESATNAENFININVLFLVRVVEILWGDQGKKWTFSPHHESQKVELAG